MANCNNSIPQPPPSSHTDGSIVIHHNNYDRILLIDRLVV